MNVHLISNVIMIHRVHLQSSIENKPQDQAVFDLSQPSQLESFFLALCSVSPPYFCQFSSFLSVILWISRHVSSRGLVVVWRTGRGI